METPDPTIEQPGDARSTAAFAAAVALAAALVFSWLILGMPGDVKQFSKYPIAAEQYLGGTLPSERLFDFSPLYLGLHIAAQRLLEDPVRGMLWLHVILLSSTAALLYLILQRRFGKGLALLGSAAFIFAKSIAIFGYTFDPEPLMIFFLTALVFFAGRRDPASSVAAGIALSLSLLTRPSFFPLVAVVPLSFLLRGQGWRPAMRSSVLFLFPVIAALVFVGVRNYGLQGRVSLLFMSPGSVFFEGSNPLSLGERAAYPPCVNDVASQFPGESDYEHAVYRLFARTVSSADLSITEANGFWAEKAMNFIRDHPLHFLSLMLRRVYYLFHSHRWYDMPPAWSAEQALKDRNIPFIPYAPLSALALLGVAFALSRWRQSVVPLALFLNQAAVMALTYATDRQRVSLYPFVIFFAVLAMARMRAGIAGRRYFLAAFLLLTILFAVEDNRMQNDSHIWRVTEKIDALTEEAFRDRDELNVAGARQKLAQILTIAPWTIESGRPAGIWVEPAGAIQSAVKSLPSPGMETPSEKMDRALLLIEADRLDEAERILTELANKGYAFDVINRNPDPLYHLGVIAALRRNTEEAGRYMQAALRKSPGHPEILAFLSCLTGDRRYTDAVFRYYDDIDASFFLGRECLKIGRPEKAVEHFSRMNALFPTYTKGKIYFAAALGAAGRTNEAAARYLSTAGDRPPLVILENYIVPAFERWAQQGSPEARYWQGIVSLQYGYFERALSAFKRSAAAGNAAARREFLALQAVMNTAARE
jgi:tetratricopeptide (TPR) repeat protein